MLFLLSNKMIKIGLTGGIGSGKSTVAHIFETLGIPVYYADAASKRLMNEDDELKNKIKSAFGKKVIQMICLTANTYLILCLVILKK